MKRIMLPVLLAIALLANPVAAEDIKAVSPESVGLSSQRLERVGDFMRGYMDRKQMAGAVVLIARKGKIAYFEPFGIADTGRPMRRDSMFRICSMTKPVVTLAPMDTPQRTMENAPTTAPFPTRTVPIRKYSEP